MNARRRELIVGILTNSRPSVSGSGTAALPLARAIRCRPSRRSEPATRRSPPGSRFRRFCIQSRRFDLLIPMYALTGLIATLTTPMADWLGTIPASILRLQFFHANNRQLTTELPIGVHHVRHDGTTRLVFDPFLSRNSNCRSLDSIRSGSC